VIEDGTVRIGLTKVFRPGIDVGASKWINAAGIPFDLGTGANTKRLY